MACPLVALPCPCYDATHCVLDWQVEIDDSDTQKMWLKSARGRKAAKGKDWLAGAELPHAHGYRVIPAAVRDGRIVQAPTTPAPLDQWPWVRYRTDEIYRHTEGKLCCGHVRRMSAPTLV